MFLSRALTKTESNINTKHEHVCHIANSTSVTLCKRYTPSEVLSEKYLFYLLGNISLRDYLNDICLGKTQNPNICRLCINTYKKLVRTDNV
jgi:hypothetical protein